MMKKIKRLLWDKRNIVISLLASLCLIKIPQGGLRFVLWVLAGVLSCALFDILISRTFLKRKISVKSAIISGFIVAGILDHQQPFFILLVFTFIAIASKHIIKFKQNHVFNPANFALFSATVFKIPLTWNIESNIYLIIIAGIYIAYTMKRIPHITGFLIFFSTFLFFSDLNPLNLISWFFIFIMLIEPKTSGFRVLKGFIFGSIAGISSFLIFKLLPQYNFFVTGLFMANLCNSFLEKIIGYRGRKI